MRALFVALAGAMLLIAASVVYVTRSGHTPGSGNRPMSVTSALSGADSSGFERAVLPRPFHFPDDHGPHPGFRNEWWYFTGNLQASDGRRFGYELTFFRVALTPHPVPRTSAWASDGIYLAHFALTDVAAKRFRYAERYSRAALGLAGAGGSPLTLWLENWSMREAAGHPFSVRLSAADPAMAIELNLKALTPEILNGDGGLSRKSAAPGNASYYYSIPRMETVGTVRSGKETFTVSGISWLDREWSTSALDRNQVGWDWFALQLDDGRDIMFYRVRRRDGSIDPFSSGTLVFPDGSSKPLANSELRLEVEKWWTSPASGSRYPSIWRMSIPSQHLDVRIRPRLADQELQMSFRYWEGAVNVEAVGGSSIGEGYVELTGYQEVGGVP